jgi:methylase of polypeptide subunit release factors
LGKSDPKPKSALHLLEYLDTVPVKGAALDIGTGYSGVLAASLLKLGAHRVVALDIDPSALERAAQCTSISARIDWRVSNLFAALEEGMLFETIVSNPPQLPMASEGKAHDYGGCDGRGVLLDIFRSAPRFMRNDGRLILGVMDYLGVDQSYNHAPSLLELAARNNLDGQIVLSRRVAVRSGGATEASLAYIKSVYPKYDFKSMPGRLSYQYQVVEFRKSHSRIEGI